MKIKKVYFIGAGPGAADLITVRGANLLKQADVVIYAGSLVDDEMLKWCKSDALKIDSAKLTLEQVIEETLKSVNAGKLVVRLHSGDPSIYGAIQEQIDILNEKGVGTEVVPGVSSFSATASVLQQELTLPGVSQTVILTRLPGRTEASEWEDIKSLAKASVTFCFFLSSHTIKNLVDQLIEAGFDKDLPIALVENATRSGERIHKSTLENILTNKEVLEIKGTSMIIIGRVLNKKYKHSKLYDASFAHGFRS